tara:strand:+ start:1523 stop:1999 length:477 start_codon:yes stop_codon:yes gene_type:complete
MNSFNIKYIYAILLIVLTSCSYQPIFSEKNYNFEINEIEYSGDKQISNIIKNKLNLIKKSEGQSKKEYNLSINNYKEKIIVSKDSKGDPLKFELIVTTVYEVKNDDNLLLSKKIKKNNIYNNETDKFKLEQNEKIIIENLSEKVSEVIISSIINLDDN